jgi:tetratricopeptide (TPR) repeat protein
VGFWFQRSVELGRDLTFDLADGSPYPAGSPPLSYAIPGTPLFYRDDIYVHGRPSVPPPSPPYLQIRPEIVGASGAEEPFANGVSALAFGDVDDALAHLERAAEDARGESTFASIRLALALVALAQERPADAVELLRTVVASDESLPDDRMKKSLVRGALEVHVTRNLTIHTSLDRGGAALLFAEVLQSLGRDTEAADLLETLGWRTQQPALALALADHYIERDLHAEVSRVTGRFTANVDDLSLQILLLRARARRSSGDLAFALATLEEALRFPDRDPHLLRAVHYERALTLEARGHEELALRELGSIYDEDPGFRDVATRLSLFPKTQVRGRA